MDPLSWTLGCSRNIIEDILKNDPIETNQLAKKILQLEVEHYRQLTQLLPQNDIRIKEIEDYLRSLELTIYFKPRFFDIYGLTVEEALERIPEEYTICFLKENGKYTGIVDDTNPVRIMIDLDVKSGKILEVLGVF
jgi:hypothetical protein